MQKQLAGLVQSLESAQTKLRSLSDRVSGEQWARRPVRDAWSAAQCVEHLNMTSRAYIPLLRTAIDEARSMRSGAVRYYRMDVAGRLLAFMMRPMKHIGKFKLGRVKTTGAFTIFAGTNSADVTSVPVQVTGDVFVLAPSTPRMR